MIGVVLKGLLGRKLRAALTAIAIVLGIAMVSGTYVLTDTIKAGFNGLFQTVYQNADAVVSGKSAIGGDNTNGPGLAPSFSQSLLSRVRALPELSDAGANVAYPTFLVGPNGKILATNAGGLGFGIDPKRANGPINPLRLVTGAWPTSGSQIAIDVSTASKKHFAVGDSIGAVASGAAHRYRIVGVVKLGAASIGGTTLAVFDLATGQRLFHKVGRLDTIYMQAKAGVTPPTLVGEVQKILPATAQVRTASAQAKELRVRGIIDPPKGGSPFADVTIPNTLFDRVYVNPTNLFSFVTVRGGVTPENTVRLSAALKPFPDAKLQTESQFKKNQEKGITLLLNLLYVLLSLSIVVSLFGIVNTLILTVFERTRELGMLRAVGMTRRQVRNMIRYESVVTALIGAALGIPVGIGLGALVGHAIAYPKFTVPWGTVVVFVLAAIVAGLVAAILPARRAGRLNVLAALQYE